MTRAPAPGRPAADVDVRRWIRRRRIAAEGRVDVGTVYLVFLAVLMAVALVGESVAAVVWPRQPPSTGPSATVVVGAVAALAAFFVVLRQLGPLAISRSDATWLLPAPVSRRLLLTPALALTTGAALVLGGATGLAVAGHLAARPAGPGVLAGAVTTGGAAAIIVALVALYCQQRPTTARVADGAGVAVGVGCLLVAAGFQMFGTYRLPRGWAPPAAAQLALGCLALAAALGAVLAARRRLDRWPTAPIAEAAVNAGAYADVVYAVEPSFLAELSARRFWRRRTGIRTTRLVAHRRLPPLVAQDLLMVRRKAGRLWWLAGGAALPTLLADGPGWLAMGVLLVGALAAAGLTGESTHSDAANPALLRLLGVTGRWVTVQRLAVPAVIGACWGALALGGLQVAGELDGPWWALGLAAGPAVAAGAFQRARASAASIGTILIDTPLGAFPAGVLLWLVNGIDVLAVLTLPVSIGLLTARAPEVLGWPWVLAQAASSLLGCLILIKRSATTTSKL
ncbi:DUF6297 family protein [Micromonospora sp. DT233]|uniref:DUF6297 family protein n=1 Tax=Micromonospora sp. DT233 TaxID=3393432 RepID=UPI003CE6B2F5